MNGPYMCIMPEYLRRNLRRTTGAAALFPTFFLLSHCVTCINTAISKRRSMEHGALKKSKSFMKKIYSNLYKPFTHFITINYEFSSFARQIFLMC